MNNAPLLCNPLRYYPRPLAADDPSRPETLHSRHFDLSRQLISMFQLHSIPKRWFGTVALVFLFLLPGACGAEIFVAATLGEPYGVATIEIPVNPPVVGDPLPALEVSEQSGRVLYPIAEDLRTDVESTRGPDQRPGRLLDRVRTVIRDLTDDEEEPQQTIARRVSFLFIGDEPLRVQLGDSNERFGTYEIVPSNNPPMHTSMLATWWKSYSEAAKRQIDSADYPASVENYLLAMLSSRTGQSLPEWFIEAPPVEDELLSTLKLIGGAKGVVERAFRESAIGWAQDPPVASLPLPEPPRWAPLYEAPSLQEVAVEPLATRIPPEFFYIRYGSFENYLWFRDLSDEYGGDISRMLMLNGLANESAARVERQLSMRTTQLSRMLGPTVIEDQALVGKDLFLGDGASMGVIFQAKNIFLLRTSLNNDRSGVAAKDGEVTLKQIKLDDRPVSLLSSVDNRVRSYMAVDGDFIMIANSETMIRRFFRVGQGSKSLAETASFRLSRQLMPLDRNDVIFVYFSPYLLRELVSPQYLIELRRRSHANADIALVHLARLAASQELDRDDSSTQLVEQRGIDSLIDLGFLPSRFSDRPDGSGVITLGSQAVDTLRGARGTFLPISDTSIDAVTPDEAEWYSRIADQYTTRFPTIDPIMIGIQREVIADSPSLERVTVHAEIAPWDPGKYGTLAKQLGPPTTIGMQFAPDDIVAVQAHVASAQLGPPTHLFAAIKDNTPPPPEDFKGFLSLYQSLRRVPGYLGAWPQPGALDRLPLGLGVGQPVGPGMSRLLGGVYRYTDGQYSVLSFQPEVLQSTLPLLSAIDAEDSAQVRFRAGNLRNSRIEGWVNEQLYQRAREGSLAGANFLGLLSRQLRVVPHQAMDRAKQVLGARLQCPLGGQYQYDSVTEQWVSDAWGGQSPPMLPPANYLAPALTWFRGAKGSLTQYQDRLVADAVIDIQRQ